MKPYKPSLLAAAMALSSLLLNPLSALAAPTGKGESTPLNLGGGSASSPQHLPGSGGGSLVRTIVGLAIVIGVIYGLYWVLKQVKSAREDKALGTGLQTLATLPLGQNCSMQLIRAGDEIVMPAAAVRPGFLEALRRKTVIK